ncbi:MAG TPA: DUF1841 family protein [Legionellaceae bacterium]|nr:DUF1841 family protein [Legionellaceae bacterium]
MFYGNTVQDTRGIFFQTWKKYQHKQALEPLESQLLTVILQHPEYLAILDQQDYEKQYSPALGITNPFLHMGLHLTIRDQIALDRPVGIKAIFQQLCHHHNDDHQVEHLLFEPLIECLWQAQKNSVMPDEQTYLLNCQILLNT